MHRPAVSAPNCNIALEPIWVLAMYSMITCIVRKNQRKPCTVLPRGVSLVILSCYNKPTVVCVPGRAKGPSFLLQVGLDIV